MPLYDYVCPVCQHKFELVTSMNQSKDRKLCPECDGLADRVLSPTKTVSRLNLKISQKKQRRRIM